jgi:hypothetical protein
LADDQMLEAIPGDQGSLARHQAVESLGPLWRLIAAKAG